jgi:molybdopterin-guanine dinucleotide biosynthesis protein A
VLAGGASRRYGTDKLAADVAGAPLLDRTVAGLAPQRRVIIVGPDRPVGRAVEFVPDDHPGGGPAAAMITGLRAALATPAELITVLPGDAPGAGAAAEALLARLDQDPESAGVLAVDADGREQPLQFAVRRATADRLIRTAGPDAGAGQSARRLVLPLGLAPVELAGAETWDIDTPEQHRAWAWRDSPAVRMIEAAIAAAAPERLILLGQDPAELLVLARAVTLAPSGLIADPAEPQSGDGWSAQVLRPPARRPARTPVLRVALRSPRGAATDPGDIDLWVPHPNA